MKKLISSVLLAVIAAVSAVLFSIGVTLAQSAPDVSSGPRLAGIANCPTGTLEAFLIPYARGGGPCETVLTCLNTSTKDGGFTGQFFFGFEIPKQVATLVLHCWQVRPARQQRRLLIPFLFLALTPMPLRVFLRVKQEFVRRAVPRWHATLILSVLVD